MRFLGISETCDLGALYQRLLNEGHEVRIAVSEPLAAGTMRGIVPRVEGWRAQLPWIRAAGAEGIIVFEAVSEGFGELQDRLRADGFNVIGGSAFGDRLENDRGYAQRLLAGLGFPTGHVWEFTKAEPAIAHVQSRPGRYVVKYSGATNCATSYVGQLDNGADVIALLSQFQAASRFILMDFIAGVEVGVGGYFNGTRFLWPACVDWEHKRFFTGDMGELTGEMGTVATFSGTKVLFDAILGKVEASFAGTGHVGYVNLNTIVNKSGIWPLEFTCRFGYPGFAVLGVLQRTPWGELFARLSRGENDLIDVIDGISTGIVLTTPPFPYSRKQVEAAISLPIMFSGEWSEADRAHVHYGEVGHEDDQLVTSGLYGWTMVITGVADTVALSTAQAYDRCRRILIPNGRYRLDIGERTPADIRVLTSLGLMDRSFNNRAQ